MLLQISDPKKVSQTWCSEVAANGVGGMTPKRSHFTLTEVVAAGLLACRSIHDVTLWVVSPPPIGTLLNSMI